MDNVLVLIRIYFQLPIFSAQDLVLTEGSVGSIVGLYEFLKKIVLDRRVLNYPCIF